MKEGCTLDEVRRTIIIGIGNNRANVNVDENDLLYSVVHAQSSISTI